MEILCQFHRYSLNLSTAEKCEENAREYRAKIAGVNHMAWLLSLTKDGKDVYPEMRSQGREDVVKCRLHQPASASKKLWFPSKNQAGMEKT